ncbi:polysaccharide biosynthesis tyrosine autokinase [Arthrobacter castelli]|uniref:polysaccharide biosynthesis tyrosine autokinase n=1 Tax=Arthrobacter castelli TaxID=271431 RepID=UPI00042092B6|nr:polysaccharide biosynthesis tyrosine autokinase [Arthrobacter castelli]
MELQDYLKVFRQRWLSIVIFAIAGLAIAAVYTFLQTPQYEARTQLFVSVGGSESPTDAVQGSTFADSRISSYVTLATSPSVLEAVKNELDLEKSVDQLAGSVTASSPSETVLINVTATDPDPELAADISVTTAQKLVQAVERVEDVGLVQLSVFEKAAVPTEPVTPRTTINLALGGVLGLLIGMGVAVLREILDTRLRSEEDIKRVTDAGVLGTFAAESDMDRHPLVTQQEPYSPRAESFRQLRTHLHFTNIEGGSQSVVFTSSVPGEGKSISAINLSIMLAESGTRVLLVDADLRRPRVAKYLGLENVVGLSTVLSHQVSFEDAVQSWGPGGALNVMTAGQLAPNPSELLGSPVMEKLVQQMEEQYEVVIIDAPPLLPVTDPAVLGSIASGIILVVSADGMVNRDELARSIENIDAVNARLLGLVLNRLPITRGNYSYYDYKPDAPSKPRRGKGKRELSGMRHL